MSSKNVIKSSIVDNALVVSFPSAKEPRVWRLDMNQFLSAAVQIEENQGAFSLVIKPGNAQPEEIGVFPDRKKAVEALESITGAMLQGNVTQPVVPKTGGWFKKLLKFLLLLLIVVAAIIIFGKTRPHVNQGDTVEAPAVQSDAPAPAVQTGVPTPADQMLGK